VSPTGSRSNRHIDVALLRAATAPLTHATEQWPDLADTGACREWLDQTWSRPDLADAVRQASPSLGDSVDAIRAGQTTGDMQIRSATLSTARYLLRSIGRPTPLCLFAGVAPVTLGKTAQAHWGEGHRAVARVNTEWLADIIARAEGCPELLERLHVVVTDLAVRRGGRLEMPQGPNRVTIRYTSAVAAVRDAAATPVRFSALIDKLTEDFTVNRSTARDMLTELVRQGYLLTNLRTPFTVTDPFAHLVDRLHDAEADTVAATASLVRELEAVRTDLRHHNHETTTRVEQSGLRETITRRMRELSPAGRTPLAVDLLLDCDVRLPHQVAQETERAASALLRLTRQPTGEAATTRSSRWTIWPSPRPVTAFTWSASRVAGWSSRRCSTRSRWTNSPRRWRGSWLTCPGRSALPGISSTGVRTSGCRFCHGCATSARSCLQRSGGWLSATYHLARPGRTSGGRFSAGGGNVRDAPTWSSCATRTVRCASPSMSLPTPPSCTPM